MPHTLDAYSHTRHIHTGMAGHYVWCHYCRAGITATDSRGLMARLARQAQTSRATDVKRG